MAAVARTTRCSPTVSPQPASAEQRRGDGDQRGDQPRAPARAVGSERSTRGESNRTQLLRCAAASAAASRSTRSGRRARASGTSCRRRSRWRSHPPAAPPGRARAGRSGRRATAPRSSCRRSTAAATPPLRREACVLDRRRALLRLIDGADRVVDERLPADQRARRGIAARRRRRRPVTCASCACRCFCSPARCEPGELAERVRVLGRQHVYSSSAAIALGGLAVGLQRRREVTPRLRRRSGSPRSARARSRPTARRSSRRAAEDVADAGAAGTDAEHDEAAARARRRGTRTSTWRGAAAAGRTSCPRSRARSSAWRGGRAATAAFCFGPFGLLFSNRAIRSFLSGSAPRRLRE